MNVFITVPLVAALVWAVRPIVPQIAKVIVAHMVISHSKELTDKQTQAICNMMQMNKKHSRSYFKTKS